MSLEIILRFTRPLRNITFLYLRLKLKASEQYRPTGPLVIYKITVDDMETY